MKSSKKILCTAGFSYFLLYPNGDVYRCLADYNAKRSPMGNFFDTNFSLFSIPQPCNNFSCYAFCDLDWTTKYVVKNDNTLIKKIPAREWDGIISGFKIYNRQDFTYMPTFKDVAIIWTPTLRCNFNCPYCGCGTGPNRVINEFPSSFPEYGAKTWIKAFEKFLPNINFGLMQTNGGEPFLAQCFLDVLAILSKRMAINIVTNLSQDIMEFIRAGFKSYDRKNKTGIIITASLHPFSKSFNFEQFLGRILLLKEKGFLNGINFVAYPEQMYLYDYYRKLFGKFKIPLWIQPWCGTDNKGFQGYTEEEKKFVNIRGNYSRKVNNHLDFTGLVAKDTFSHEIIKAIFPSKWPRDKLFPVRIKIKNCGCIIWSKKNADIKVGLKILPNSYCQKPVKEFRAQIEKEVSPGYMTEIITHLDFSNIFPGSYLLIIDMVYENKFWFSQRGSSPFEGKIEII